jgi:hypothetical protein
MVRAETLGEDGKRLVLYRMQTLVGALTEVTGVREDGGEEVRHLG